MREVRSAKSKNKTFLSSCNCGVRCEVRSAKYKFTSIVNSKGAKREVRNWTKSLLDKTVPGHFRFGQKILDIFVVTRLIVHERVF